MYSPTVMPPTSMPSMTWVHLSSQAVASAMANAGPGGDGDPPRRSGLAVGQVLAVAGFDPGELDPGGCGLDGLRRVGAHVDELVEEDVTQ